MESAIAIILEAGTSGAFVVILMFVVAYLYKAREKSMQEHLTDLKSFSGIVETVRLQLQATEQALKSMVEYVKGSNSK